MVQSRHIDMNRGVQMSKHPEGYYVCMYFDDPGVYMTQTCTPLGDAEAAAAGYDVAELSLTRERNKLMREGQAKLEREIAELTSGMRDEIDRKLTGEGGTLVDGEDVQITAAKQYGAMGATNKAGQLRETEFYKMDHFGGGLWNVTEKGTRQIVPGGEKITGSQAALLMVRLESESESAAGQR